MEFKITNQTENPLFNRKEIQAEVQTEVTPNHAEVEKLISEKFSTQPKNIRIKKISGKFGSKTFTITANIYDSKEDKEKTEPESKRGAVKLTEEALVEQPASEKPTEVPKEAKE